MSFSFGMLPMGASANVINQIIKESKEVQKTIMQVSAPLDREILQEWDVIDLVNKEGIRSVGVYYLGYLWYKDKFVPVGFIVRETLGSSSYYAFVCLPSGEIFYLPSNYLTNVNVVFTPEYAIRVLNTSTEIHYYTGTTKTISKAIDAVVSYAYKDVLTPWSSKPAYYIYPEDNGDYVVKDMNLSKVGKLTIPYGRKAYSRFNVISPEKNLFTGVVIDVNGVSGYANKPQLFVGDLNNQHILIPYNPDYNYNFDHLGIPNMFLISDHSIYVIGWFDTGDLPEIYSSISMSGSCIKVKQLPDGSLVCEEYSNDYVCVSFTPVDDEWVCDSYIPNYVYNFIIKPPAVPAYRDFTSAVVAYAVDESLILTFNILLSGFGDFMRNIFNYNVGSSYYWNFMSSFLSRNSLTVLEDKYSYYNITSSSGDQFTYHVSFHNLHVSGYNTVFQFVDTLLQNVTNGTYSFIPNQYPPLLVNGEYSVPKDAFPFAIEVLEDGTVELYTIELIGNLWQAVKYNIYPKK